MPTSKNAASETKARTAPGRDAIKPYVEKWLKENGASLDKRLRDFGVARVRAVLRRTDSAREGGAEILRAADVEIDVPRMRVEVAGRRVELTPTEFQLLSTMARQPGRVFSRAQLLSAVHGVAVESYERAIDAHIKNLRRKIEPEPHDPRYLLTVFGVGYRFADPRR